MPSFRDIATRYAGPALGAAGTAIGAAAGNPKVRQVVGRAARAALPAVGKAAKAVKSFRDIDTRYLNPHGIPKAGKQLMGGAIAPQAVQAVAKGAGLAYPQGISHSELLSQIPYSPQLTPNLSKVNLGPQFNESVARELGSQAGAMVPGAAIAPGVGLAGVGLAAGAAGMAIDRGMRQTYGTGLPQNVREGLRNPMQSARSGVEFLQENSNTPMDQQRLFPDLPQIPLDFFN